MKHTTTIVGYATVAYTRTVPHHLIEVHPPDHDLGGILTTHSKLRVLEYLRTHNLYPATGDLTIIADEEMSHMEDDNENL